MHECIILVISGLEANVSMSKPKTSVSTMMKDIIIVDPTPNAVYPHVSQPF